MKKPKVLFVDRRFIKIFRGLRARALKTMTRLAALGFGMAAVSQSAQAAVIIHDDFTSGGQYGGHLSEVSPGPGKTPSGASAVNLPGGTWLLAGEGVDGVGDFNTTNSGLKIGTVSKYATTHNLSAAAISLMSSGGYTEPTALRYSVAVDPQAENGALLGFYNSVSASNYGGNGQSQLVGFNLTSAGALNLFVNGTQTATDITPGAGIFDSNGFTTLSFTLSFDTGTSIGTFSDISLGGTSYADIFTTGVVSSHTIDYAGFGSKNGGGRTAIADFDVSGVTPAPEPASCTLLLGGVAASLAARRRRSRNGV